MVLQAVGRKTEEGINKSIVPYDRQKGLLIVECIGTNDFRGGVWDGNSDKIGSWNNACHTHKQEAIKSASRAFDDPFHSGGLCGNNFGWQRRPKTDRVDHVAKVLGQLDAKFRRTVLKRNPGKLEICASWIVMIRKHLQNQCVVAVYFRQDHVPDIPGLRFPSASFSLHHFFGPGQTWAVQRQNMLPPLKRSCPARFHRLGRCFVSGAWG